jgi:FlaG/FlaF family flagellin (archaellin)
MKLLVGAVLMLMGLVACTSAAQMQNGTLTGTVERVWEDGFSINTGDRTVNVDSWDVCGDNTQQNVSVGDELTVAGEFSGGEFDATTMTNPSGEDICSAPGQTQSSPVEQTQGSAITGNVERVWEDGFSINTGDRTVNVDSWNVCGDNTQQSVSVGDELTVEGEFDDGEFDASAITNTNGENICSAASS